MRNLKHFTRSITAAILTIIGVIWLFYSSQNPSKATVLTTPDEVIQFFIDNMNKDSYGSIRDVLAGPSLGMAPPNVPVQGMELTEAESKGLLGSAKLDDIKRYQEQLLREQKRFIIQQFGQQAWDNVSYTLTKTMGPGEFVWVDISGKEISEAEAATALRDFWGKVSEKEGVDLNLVLSSPHPNSPEEAPAFADRVAKASPIIDKYLKDAPVRSVSKPTSEVYRATFKFNGQDTSSEGYSEFTIMVINDSGDWKLQDFSWSTPTPEPSGDI